MRTILNKQILCLFTSYVLASTCLFAQNNKKTQMLVPIKSLENLDELMGKQISALKGRVYEYGDMISQTTGIPLDSLTNKIIFIHTWFASCAPCVAEFGALNKVYEQLEKNKDFLFLSFTFEDKKTIEETKDKYQIKYKITGVTREQCSTLNLRGGFPLNILLRNNLLIDNIYTGLGTGGNIANYIDTHITTDIQQLLSTKAGQKSACSYPKKQIAPVSRDTGLKDNQFTTHSQSPPFL